MLHPEQFSINTNNETKKTKEKITIVNNNVKEILNFNNCNDKCLNCIIHCRFEIDQINKIRQKDLINELQAHGHTKSMKINGSWRTVAQGKIELINHYKNHQN